MTELGTSLALVGAYMLAIALRDASMRWMGRWPIRRLKAEQSAKAGDITLPDYRHAAVR